MRKLVRLIVVLIFMSNLAFSQNVNIQQCKGFKKGNFIQNGKEYIKIKRGRKYQIEIDEKFNTKSKYKISWKSACEFSLTLIESNDKETTQMLLNNPIDIKITSIEGNKYSYTLEIFYDTIISGIRKKGSFKQNAALLKIN